MLPYDDILRKERIGTENYYVNKNYIVVTMNISMIIF